MVKPETILVVDDQEENLFLMRSMLESMGFAVEVSQTGADALSKLDGAIDLVLLDVLMPDMDGFEVVREIRGSSDFQNLPVIMVTSLTSKKDRLQAVEAGANDFISKPIERTELRVRVESLLKMKRAQDALKRHKEQLEETVQERTAELREREERYRELYEDSSRRERLYDSILTSTADAIVVCDLQGDVTYVNPAFSRICGWAIEDVQGKNLGAVSDFDEQAWKKVFQRVRSGGTVSDVETRGRAQDGGLLDISVSGARFVDHRGRPSGIVVVLHDITERKEAERALRVSEQRFTAVFEAAQDAIFVKDCETRYTHVNPAMLAALGLQSSDLAGKTDAEVFGPNEAVYLRDLEDRVLKGQVITATYSITLKDRLKSFECVRVPLKDSAGQTIGLCGIARDVTEFLSLQRKEASNQNDYISRAMRETFTQLSRVAGTDAVVILLGESGSGKDYLARYLHNLSPRAHGPFFAINCAALPADIAESELFGHESGAFTGATTRKRGLVELAEGGSLLLNEIGELPARIQAKLLSFLDTRSFIRVGGEKHISVSVRLIAATNRDLEKEVREGAFRADLFHRLNVFSIRVPSLRERREDIPLLVRKMLHSLSAKMGLAFAPDVAPEAMAALTSYDWPGNVRELQNVLERALILSNKRKITSADVGLGETRAVRPASETDAYLTVSLDEYGSMPRVLEETKRFLVSHGLHRSGGNIKEAADLLGITRDSLVHHMKALGIKR